MRRHYRRDRERLSLTVNVRSGCQKEIAKKIKEKEANYLLALKGNQGTLSEDVELFFTEQKSRKFADTATATPCLAKIMRFDAGFPRRNPTQKRTARFLAALPHITP